MENIEETKICKGKNGCGSYKSIIEFVKNRNLCKKCSSVIMHNARASNKMKNKERSKIYRDKNKDIIKEKKKIFAINNKEKISKQRKNFREINKERIQADKREYYKNNKEKIFSYQKNNIIAINSYRRQYKKNRLQEDSIFKLREYISCYINRTIIKNGSSKNNHSIMEYLPYTIQELKDHLEKQFEPWMSWKNHGIYRKNKWKQDEISTWTWQLDHIIPQASLPFSSMKDENFKRCWNLENLRPLSAKQNFEDGVTRIRHIGDYK